MKNIEEVWNFLDQFHAQEELEKALRTIPSDFGSFEIINLETFKEDGHFEICNSFWDKIDNDYVYEYHCVEAQTQQLEEVRNMKTYYIEIEEQCSMVLAIIKVEAENEEEAKLKALKALHATQDIYSITEEEAQNLIDSGEIDYMLDEDGCEIGIDEEDQ